MENDSNLKKLLLVISNIPLFHELEEMAMVTVVKDTETFARKQFGLLGPFLNEKGRRMWAGALALQLGYGGIAAVVRCDRQVAVLVSGRLTPANFSFTWGRQ